MKKTFLTLSTAALMATGVLAGCGASNGAMNDNGITPQKVGYYTSQNPPNPNNPANNNNDKNNLAYDNSGVPNDGANNNVPNNNMQYGANNNMPNNNGQNNAVINGKYNSTLANRIQNKVNRLPGVNGASVLLNGNRVIVGVHANTNNNTSQGLENKVKSTVNKVTPNRTVQVVTDQAMVNRIMNVNDRLSNGTAYNEVTSDINAIVNGIGDAVKRPFQNNAQ